MGFSVFEAGSMITRGLAFLCRAAFNQGQILEDNEL